MRNLFLAVLLANVLFLGWQLWIAPPEVPAERLLSPGTEPEIRTSGAATAQGPSAGAGMKAADAGSLMAGEGSCTRIGPIADGQDADALRARLAASGITSSMASEEGQIWVGHWVQIESVASREEADRVVSGLAAGGLPDAYVLQTSPPFSISLGVFRDRGRAEAVIAAAVALGFQPQITDRFRAGAQYWLSFVLPPGRNLPVDVLGRESGQILRAEQAPCPSASIGGTPSIN